MGGKTISNSETKIEALKLQSSAYGVTVAKVYGVTRISGNLLDYLGFQAVPHTETQGGKGGGVKVQNTTYTYKADVMMGLCHGPVTEVPRIWRGKKLYQGGWLPTQIQTSSETYTPPASGAMAYTVANAATWLGVVRVVYEEGAASEGGTYFYFAVAGEGTQYVAAAGVVTVLDEALRGTPLTITYQWAAGARAQTAMDQLGLTFKPGTVGQAAWSALPAGRAVPYSGLAYVAGQGYDLGTGAQVENHMFEVVGPMAYHLGAAVPDVDPSDMLRAVLTDLQGGAGFPAGLLGDWSAWSAYCRAAGVLVSPAMTEQAQAAEIIRTAARLTNAAPVWSGGRLKMVPLADEAETGNGATYTPDTTPVYDLDDESYTPGSAEASPIRVRLKSAAERHNHWRVEFLNRGNQYNVEIAEAKDAADIEEHGLRSAEVLRAHWICTPEAARKVAQTLLQRSLYINAEYEVPLPWHYALIEPADLLTLADARLGFDRLPVRVTVVQESEEGDLLITAEDYPPGTASAAAYPTQAGSGYTANYNADPGDVDTPTIFEAPYTLAVTGLEVYAAVRGTTSLWGGCQVWVSLDGVSYKQVGTIYGPSRYGTLAGALSDSGTTVAVQGLGAQAQLLAGSAADAEALQTLCYLGGVDEEYVAYEGATLTAPGAYTLSDLVRGAHGTTAAAHASGAPFVRVDDRIAKSGAIDPVMIGRTMYFKFTSFNLWGGGQQQLDAVPEWPYTITGSMAELAPQPGSALLRLSPATAVVQANAVGQVSDWSPARAVATVTAPDGSDDTAGWTYTIDSAVNLTAALSGGLGNVLSVTGFSAGVDPLHRNVLIQVHGYPTAADTSQYARAPRSVHAGVSFIDGPTPVGAGFVRLPAGTAWHDLRHLVDFGGYDAGTQDPTLVDASGQPWDLQAFVRVNVQGTAEATLVGNSARRISVASDGAGVRLHAVWYRRAANAFGSAADTATALAGASVIALGTWVHARVSYCSDGVLRFWVGGVLQASASIGAGWRDAFHPDSPYSARFTLGTFFFSTTALGPEADLCEVRHLAGVSGPLGGNFTPPSAPFVDAAAPASGAVVVRAAKAGQADLTARLDVSVLRAPLPVVTATATPATLTLAADWQGNVTAPSVASVVAVSVNGVGETSAWGMVVDPDQVSGLFGTLAAPAVTATAMHGSRSSGEVRAWLSRPGYPAQRVVIPVAKTFAAQSVVVAGGPASMAVQADWADTTASNLPLSATISAMNGGTNEAGLYSWTRTASAGLTTTISGPTVTLTAMASGTLTSTITMTGTRSGWPTLTWTIAVTKALDPQPVVVPGGPASVTVAGATDGTVPAAGLPVSATVTAAQAGTDVATSYSWTPSASAGITASNTAGGPTFEITAMATGTDSGTVTMTGVRSGWPTLTWVIAVAKTKLLPVVGSVADWGFVSCLAFGVSSATARVLIKSDGRVTSRINGIPSESYETNWHGPTTAGIGSSRWAKLTKLAGDDPTGPALATVHALSSDLTISLVRSSTGSVDGTYLVEIYSDSGGSTKVGQGTVYLAAEIS